MPLRAGSARGMPAAHPRQGLDACRRVRRSRLRLQADDDDPVQFDRQESSMKGGGQTSSHRADDWQEPPLGAAGRR